MENSIALLDHTEREHAILSPSSSHRWLVCPASVSAEAVLPNTTNKFAEEGTKAHEIAQQYLATGNREEFETLTADNPEMQYELQKYFDYINHICNGQSVELFIEERVKISLPSVKPDGVCFGTVDCAVVVDDTLHVIDLKYGKYTVVDARENTQLMLYALGMFDYINADTDLKNKYNVESITVHIVQPRANNFSNYSFDLKELKKFSRHTAKAAKLVLSDNPPRVGGGDQCKWCKAKDICPDAVMSETVKGISVLMQNKIQALSKDDKITIVENKKNIIAFLEELERAIINDINSGVKYHGYSVGESRTNRKWADGADEVLVNVLGDEAYTKTLITITKAEKLLEKNLIDHITIKEKGKPKLVKVKEYTPDGKLIVDDPTNRFI